MKTLRIATLNCLNLALPGRRFYDGADPYTADEYIAKTQWLAVMLDRLAADVVLLQEIFHEQALSDVVRQTAGGTRAWSLAAPLAGPDNVKPRLGIAWRRSWPLSLRSIADFPPDCAVEVPESGRAAGFSRPLLRAELPLPDFGGGVPMAIFNVHLKSRRPDFVAGEDPTAPGLAARAQLRSLIRRGAEAAALRSIVEQVASRTPLVVAGDFNDDIGAATTRLLVDPPAAPDDADEPPFRLFDVFDLEPVAAPGASRPVPFTCLGEAGAERIDHLLVSRHFVPGSRDAIGRVASVEVFSDHLRERRRSDAVGRRLDRVYADHAGVCVAVESLG